MSDNCYHCGQRIENERVVFDEKDFCCYGCRSVYEVLNINHLEKFYELNKSSGVRPGEKDPSDFAFLDTEEVFHALVDFSEGTTSVITFKIPVIHCTSCIWLLESLKTLNKNIHYSQVNFTRKTVQISFNHLELPLSELAVMLTNLGYKPVITLESAEKTEKKADRSLLIKLGIAGFAFGNGMFFSFPEYFGGNDIWLEQYKWVFRGVMVFLSLPVVLYSASGYYQSAWYGLKNKVINIDVPIVIGILVLFGRSIYEITTDYGPGYFDTLCGLLFFMLLGKIFQQRTYQALSYDRDYKSFYPIAVTKVENGGVQKNIMLKDLQIGDRILIRNQEIIPADAILIQGDGNIDNSFITGESATLKKNPGDKIFAGGKQVGSVIELEIIKNINQSYLTQLWNNDAFKKQESGLDTLTNSISKYFTIAILLIALVSGIYWARIDMEKMFQVVSAILIVACPCALALSAPFTFGHIMRILGAHQFYVKDTYVIERLSRVNTIVFDKTGTLTDAKTARIYYEGESLSEFDLLNIKTLLKNSNHPLSKNLYKELPVDDPYYPVDAFEEITGKGIRGVVRSTAYKIGSASFCGGEKNAAETMVFINVKGKFLGKYIFKNQFRKDLSAMLDGLSHYDKAILSGDNPSDQSFIEENYPQVTTFKFNQSPEDKLNFVKELQDKGKNVVMLGDGLNDAGALKQSNVGIAVADDTHTFTPSSDIIMAGEKLSQLHQYFALTADAMKIVKMTFVISLLYNVVGLTVAVSGYMDPLFAAIIMPISSISVVVFTTLSTWWRGRLRFKK